MLRAAGRRATGGERRACGQLSKRIDLGSIITIIGTTSPSWVALFHIGDRVRRSATGANHTEAVAAPADGDAEGRRGVQAPDTGPRLARRQPSPHRRREHVADRKSTRL